MNHRGAFMACHNRTIKIISECGPGQGASRHHHQGGYPSQLERRIHPAGGRVALGLPDESGVPVLVSGAPPGPAAAQDCAAFWHRSHAITRTTSRPTQPSPGCEPIHRPGPEANAEQPCSQPGSDPLASVRRPSSPVLDNYRSPVPGPSVFRSQAQPSPPQAGHRGFQGPSLPFAAWLGRAWNPGPR